MATDAQLSRAVRLLMAAHGKGGRVVALTGAGISTPSGIPDYTTGTLIEPGYQANDLSYGRFLISQRIRSAYWATCARFRALVEKAKPNAAHTSLWALATAGWIDGIVTQNVDGLHGNTGVIELHGNIFSVRCTSCGEHRAWPDDGAWINHDVICSNCGGFLKPAVIAMGENIDPMVWSEAVKLVDGCNLLLAVATRLAVSSGANLLAKARRADATTIFITQGEITGTILEDDVIVQGDAAEILRTLQRLFAIRTS
jgi:NAD-dependent deacetylase